MLDQTGSLKAVTGLADEVQWQNACLQKERHDQAW
jgi:hypothetical protein